MAKERRAEENVEAMVLDNRYPGIKPSKELYIWSKLPSKARFQGKTNIMVYFLIIFMSKIYIYSCLFQDLTYFTSGQVEFSWLFMLIT